MNTKMAMNIKPKHFIRCFYNSSYRNYCEYKSIYEREEAGRQPLKVHGQPYPEWRRPWIQKDGEWRSKLSLFVERNPSMQILSAMQYLPTLTFKDVKDWWAQMKTIQEIQNQKYLPERVAALGVNLAAVHYFSYRSAAVKLRDSQYWLSSDPDVLMKLPDHYIDGYYVEAIDCTNFHHNGIRFEGLQNLSGLSFLKWLSLRNNKFVDIWCLDRIAGQNGKTIEFLDISGCNLCVGGVFALSRMQALKFLVVSDPGDNMELQAALSMLEEDNPKLIIKIQEPEMETNVQK